ncbi:hypothetical protein BDP27DRAFT_1312856 [Rhodocollybia butyracea]|uniref:Uncharacterized protein n=1 Tax=Rhodocollybia butyracea TaxID=206335 RepID=A0A9P5Q2J9_9AGAR|nr:hypothetical protein BDP27DRAFT_1312856 [Rhodocollybia butyracea]
MSLSGSASRPGPLCEWPLDSFLPSSSSSKPSVVRPNKRPFSPDGPVLFSPAKRRILTQEGIFSPEKMIKSPFRAPALKKLEFRSLASPLTFARPSTPVKPCTTRSLAPSPEIGPTIVTKSTPRRTLNDADDFFATPERLHTPSPSPSYTLVPRDLPPPMDPQSIHYPGFTVYQDPHIPVISSVDLDYFPLEDRDESKENFAPRRKLKKAITDPVDARTPESKKKELEKLFKAKSTPATPRKTASRETHEVTSPTPRRPGLRTKVGTPVITEEEKRQRRRMLRDEVEETALMDDDDDI